MRFDSWTEADPAPCRRSSMGAKSGRNLAIASSAPGSLAISDNRTTWHVAVNDYAGQRRLLLRITVKGVALN